MIVNCFHCKRNYNDEYSWTICPHNSLNFPADAVYCRRCDIYVGYTNIGTRSDKPNECMICGRTKDLILAGEKEKGY